MDGSQIHKVIEFTLDRLQGKAGLVHDLSLIKGTTVINDKEPQNSDSGNRSSALALFSWTKRLEKNNDLKIKSGSSKMTENSVKKEGYFLNGNF